MNRLIFVAFVIQNCRNMTHSIRRRRGSGAQSQIMKLSSFKAWSQESDLLDERSAIDGKIADIVLREQQVRVPSRLEPRINALTGSVYLIIIGVDYVGRRICSNFNRHLIERMLRQEIADPKKGHKLTLSQV